MAWTILDQNSSGAPSLLAVNGSLTSLLRWALPQLGWDIEYGTTGNSAVFRAQTGNRLRLQCVHQSSVSGAAQLAMIRGAHGAADANTITDPFPTIAQVANNACNWIAAASTTVPANFIIAGNGTFFHYFVLTSSGWDWGFFGDTPSDYTTGYETAIGIRNATATATPSGMGDVMRPYPEAEKVFWARGIDGTTVSTYGCKDGAGSAPGRVQGSPPMRGGYQNRVLRQKIAVHDTGSVTTTDSVLSIPRRGWLPNVWNPLHNGNGAVADGDTFTDSDYNSAASFKVLDATTSGTLILETTDTWVKP